MSQLTPHQRDVLTRVLAFGIKDDEDDGVGYKPTGPGGEDVRVDRTEVLALLRGQGELVEQCQGDMQVAFMYMEEHLRIHGVDSDCDPQSAVAHTELIAAADENRPEERLS